MGAIVENNEKLLCSKWARSINLVPAGTAGTYDGILLLEWPLPWPRDVSEISRLGNVIALARELGVRIQLINKSYPETYNLEDVTSSRIACYHRVINKKYFQKNTLTNFDEPFSGDISDRFQFSSVDTFYSGLGLLESRTADDDVAEAALKVLELVRMVRNEEFLSISFGKEGKTFSPDEVEFVNSKTENLIWTLENIFDETPESSLLGQDPVFFRKGEIRDILICTHGRRDRCCGSLGMNLYAEVQDMLTKSQYLLRDNSQRINCSRTTHTGGHRFAPTGVLLPQGTLWGFLDQEIIDRILSRDVDCVALKDYYRGSIGLSRSEFQIVEAELFGLWNSFYPQESGWDFFDSKRQAYMTDDGQVIFSVVSADDEVRRFTARLEKHRSIDVPECGIFALQEESQESRKAYIEYNIVELVKVNT